MPSTTLESEITQKTKELCQTILGHPSTQAARSRIEAFLADEKSRAQYEGVMAKGQELQQKQQSSVTLTGKEISDFEKDRDALLRNPVARGFLDAQEELHQVHASVSQFVSKALELGRVPEESDLDSGSCGQGCGCGHSH
jgi:cell fate (sporulation/competence/biofilm development) regulator YlbF (YheA/YmcA/DUF963 family)